MNGEQMDAERAERRTEHGGRRTGDVLRLRWTISPSLSPHWPGFGVSNHHLTTIDCPYRDRRQGPSLSAYVLHHHHHHHHQKTTISIIISIESESLFVSAFDASSPKPHLRPAERPTFRGRSHSREPPRLREETGRDEYQLRPTAPTPDERNQPKCLQSFQARSCL